MFRQFRVSFGHSVVGLTHRIRMTGGPQTRALILAAGLGSRLSDGRKLPKPLREVAGVPLIVRVIQALGRGGVTDVGIVIGYLGEILKAQLEQDPRLQPNAGADVPRLHFFDNDEYTKPNGTSVLKARTFITGPTFLLMSDHLWSPNLLRAVAAYPLKDDQAVLGIDRRIDACFDLDDATKVLADGDTIVAIHKQLDDYNALDTGLFLITPALIAALDDANGPDGCSLSDGVGALARAGKMKVVDVGEARWIDVDTPEAHAEAERLLALYGDDLMEP